MASAKGSSRAVVLPTQSGQDGAIKVESVPVEDLALPIEWKTIGVFADQIMGQEAGSRAYQSITLNSGFSPVWFSIPIPA